MSQTKAQLIQPVGVVTAGGVVVTGVVTASSFTGDVVGSATSIISGGNLNLGDVNATTFSGDFTGTATGINTGADIKVGQFTASSFTGDFTGTATSMFRGTGFKAGAVNATGFNVSGTSAGTIAGNVTGDVTGDVTGVSTGNVTGNVTGNITGYAKSVTSGANIHVGVLTAITFSGDGSNLSGIAATNYNTQVVPGSTFSINVTASGSSNYTLSGTDRSGSVSGSDPTVTVEVGDTLNFVVDASGHPFYIRVSDGGANVSTPAATNQGSQSGTVSWTPNTAGTYYYQCGNHAGMIGTITVTATTTIDLSAGNMITFNQSANTTVSFANTSAAMDVTIIRVKDANTTARTITWPDSVKWNGGSAPTLISDSESGDSQQFQFLTRDSGLTWYAWEPYNVDLTRMRLLAWGQNTVGNLGLGDVLDRSSPTQVGGLTNWANNAGQQQNKSGDQGGGSLKTDGTLWLWGQNYRGDLGQNAGDFPASRSSPVQVGSDTTWSSWSRGYQGSVLATKTNGTLWGWGNNGTGRLGLNDITTRSSPAQIGTSTGWTTGDSTKIATNLSAGAINASGELFKMGYNNWGELGLNDRAWRSSPTQIPGTWKCTDVEHFSAGSIKTNGTMWSWGQNYYGMLGQNNLTNRSSPTQVGTDTTWSQFHFGEETAIAIKTNGTLWAWGRNDSSAAGNLGLNDQVQRSSPTQVGTDTTWSQVNGAVARSFTALKTDGSLWVWGNGSYYGNLGLNDSSPSAPYISSPTQLPGTYERIISNSRGFSVLKQP